MPAVPTVEDFVDPRVAENVRREAECRQACLGFTMIDFKADKWEFGRWNNRELNRANVQKIKENLRTSVKNKKLDTAVRLIMHESEIDPNCLIQEKDLGGPIPALQFIGVPPLRLTLASGHHRRNALMEYIKEIDDKIESLEADLSGLGKREQATTAQRERATKVKDTLKELMGRRKSIGPWLAVVYSEGQL